VLVPRPETELIVEAATTIWSDRKLVGRAADAKERTRLALVAEEVSSEAYAMAMPRNDSAFRLEVNKALTQVYVGGDIERIFGQWLGKLGRPTGVLKAMYLLNSIPD